MWSVRSRCRWGLPRRSVHGPDYGCYWLWRGACGPMSRSPSVAVPRWSPLGCAAVRPWVAVAALRLV